VVKRTTGLHRREELALVREGGLAEMDASDHCNLTFALSGAPLQMQTKHPLLIGASALE